MKRDIHEKKSTNLVIMNEKCAFQLKKVEIIPTILDF